MTALLTNATADAASSAIVYSSATTISVFGTMGGASVVIEVTPDAGTTWIPVYIASGIGAGTLTLEGTFSFRTRLIGATAVTNVTSTYNGSAA